MMPFRLARRRSPAAVPGQSATRRARTAASRGRWLTTVAGTCLAAVLAGWPAMLAGQGPPPGTAAGSGGPAASAVLTARSEEDTSELQSRFDVVCRLLLEKKKVSLLGCSFRFNKTIVASHSFVSYLC